VRRSEHLRTVFARQVLGRLVGDTTGSDDDWWDTPTADLVDEIARAGPLMVALAGISSVLREGGDPDVITGSSGPEAALAVAQEWVDAGIDPREVACWLRAGCWSAHAARQMVDTGLRPGRLLDDHGRPLHLVEVPNGEEMPLARAVAEEFVSAGDAVVHVIAG
jgi:hypothetical protein